VTPTARSLAKLRADGWLADKVERREGPNSHDLFGIADILAVRIIKDWVLTKYTDPDRVINADRLRVEMGDRGELLLVQATTAPNISARIRKIADNPNIGTIREAGIRIEVWGWKAPTTKRRTWELRTVDVS
jgi:hypothetical protein